jgi:hypothetical protein
VAQDVDKPLKPKYKAKDFHKISSENKTGTIVRNSSSIFDKIEFSIVTFSIVTFSLLSFSTVSISIKSSAKVFKAKDFHKISSENKTGTKKSIKGKKKMKKEKDYQQ